VIENGWFTFKVEQDDTHGDGDGHIIVIKCSNFGKRRKRKTKPYGLKAKVYIRILFYQSRRKIVHNQI
jgi:hypothetical protein